MNSTESQANIQDQNSLQTDSTTESLDITQPLKIVSADNPDAGSAYAAVAAAYAAAPTAAPAASIALASESLQRMQTQIEKAVVGQSQIIRETLIALVAGGHVLIEGVPGLGKTLLVKALAATFHGQFGRIQFTPDLMPSDVTGHTLFDAKSAQFITRKGPIFANLVLADEINRAPAKTQAALLEVMQEGQVTIEGEGFLLPLPFMVLATQNPIEQEGTYSLPEAQLDRFLIKINVGYPGDAEERALVERVTRGTVGDKLNTDNVEAVVTAAALQAMQQAAASVMVDEKIVDYAVRLVRATRPADGLNADINAGSFGFSSGSGPRGSIALIRAARANALFERRDFVTPDDIKQVALPVLRHRVRASPEMEIEGTSVDALLSELFAQVPAPRT